MVRRSTRSRRTTQRFGYSSRYEPYAPKKPSKLVPPPGRRNVNADPIVIQKAKETVKQLKVTSMDLQIEANRKAHRTSEYEIDDQLILRRGQPFNITVTFDRPYNSAKDILALELLMGARPNVSTGTRAPIDLVTKQPDADDFGFQVVSSSGNTASLKVYVACDALVGEHELVVCTQTEKEDEYRYDTDTMVIILFNPWCKKDDVFMDKEDWRQEYVMNEDGVYFYGTSSDIGSAPWYQGQFEEVALKCALELLHKSKMTYRNRAKPIEICRILSAMVNSQDDDGVLVGNWSGDYSDGVDPSAWNGSISILSQYMKTGQSVEYGQCWVFGSLLTTLCRTLGIPCRTITNFESAHDSDANLTLDYHFNEEDEPMEELNDDSIWNFHVWNDVWMARPDLPEGYGGWQALDATPQETSHGEFRMGPASLKAIKQGHVYLDYDTKFAFAEVNAETVYWMVPANARLAPKVITTDPEGVGMKISTKAVGRDSRHDITGDYKFTEGTSLERVAVYTASRYIKKNKNFRANVKQDVQFTVVLPEKTPVGQEFAVKVLVKNTSSEHRSGSVTLSGSTVYYTGVRKTKVYSSRRSFSIKAGGTETETFTFEAADYVPELTEYAGFTFFIMSKVTQTEQAFSTQKNFALTKPTLVVEAVDQAKIGQSLALTISFTNPLDRPLKNCTFRIEGPGIDGVSVNTFRHIQANESISHKLRVMPKRAGARKFLANFSSDFLKGVKGNATINVSA